MQLLQPLQWCCVDCMIHHEQDVSEEQKYMYVARTSNNRVISIVACCHSAKLCAHATWDFRSQQNGAVTRMWRSCGVQSSHKDRAIGAVRCKKEGMLLQPLRWCCVDCMIHHERMVPEEQKFMYVAQTSNNRVFSSGDLYCCLLPRCEALRTCRSGFPIATQLSFFSQARSNTPRWLTCSANLTCRTFNKQLSNRWCNLV